MGSPEYPGPGSKFFSMNNSIPKNNNLKLHQQGYADILSFDHAVGDKINNLLGVEVVIGNLSNSKENKYNVIMDFTDPTYLKLIVKKDYGLFPQNSIDAYDIVEFNENIFQITKKLQDPGNIKQLKFDNLNKTIDNSIKLASVPDRESLKEALENIKNAFGNDMMFYAYYFTNKATEEDLKKLS